MPHDLREGSAPTLKHGEQVASDEIRGHGNTLIPEGAGHPSRGHRSARGRARVDARWLEQGRAVSLRRIAEASATTMMRDQSGAPPNKPTFEVKHNRSAPPRARPRCCGPSGVRPRRSAQQYRLLGAL